MYNIKDRFLRKFLNKTIVIVKYFPNDRKYEIQPFYEIMDRINLNLKLKIVVVSLNHQLYDLFYP